MRKEKILGTILFLCFACFATISLNAVMVMNKVPPDGGDDGISTENSAFGTMVYSKTQLGAYWWLKAQCEVNNFIAAYEIGVFDSNCLNLALEYIEQSNLYFNSIIQEMPDVEEIEKKKLMNFDYYAKPFQNKVIYDKVCSFLNRADAKGLRIYHLSLQQSVYRLLLKLSESFCYPEKESMWALLEESQNAEIFANYASRLCYMIL